jgi:hypothetical protein
LFVCGNTQDSGRLGFQKAAQVPLIVTEETPQDPATSNHPTYLSRVTVVMLYRRLRPIHDQSKKVQWT